MIFSYRPLGKRMIPMEWAHNRPEVHRFSSPARIGSTMNHKEIERWYRLKNLMKACEVLVVVAVVIVALWYVAARFLRERPEELVSSAPTGAGMRISSFSYSVPGPHPWELRADSAVVSESLDNVVLHHPKVVYSGVGSGKAYLESDSGELDKKKKSVVGRGNVKVTYRDFIFSTEEIQYSQEKGVAETALPVSFEGGRFSVTGKGMVLSVNTGEITIEEVKATIRNVSLLDPKGRLPF
jgi:LPS export ABC transporter protein LptC